MNCRYCGHELVKEECPSCGSLTCLEDGYHYAGDYHAYCINWLRPKIYLMLLRARACGLRRNLAVTDLGCGAGHALHWAKQYGCQTIGYDIEAARSSVKYADVFYSSLPLLRVHQRDTQDIVWCWHTIEHTNDPAGLLNTAYKILKPGGTLYLEFPEAHGFRKEFGAGWRKHSFFPEHRGIPSFIAIARLLHAVGFSSLEFQKPSEGNWLYLKGRGTYHQRIVAKKS